MSAFVLISEQVGFFFKNKKEEGNNAGDESGFLAASINDCLGIRVLKNIGTHGENITK